MLFSVNCQLSTVNYPDPARDKKNTQSRQTGFSTVEQLKIGLNFRGRLACLQMTHYFHSYCIIPFNPSPYTKAEVAQWSEHDLSMVRVVGSSPAFCSLSFRLFLSIVMFPGLQILRNIVKVFVCPWKELFFPVTFCRVTCSIEKKGCHRQLSAGFPGIL